MKKMNKKGFTLIEMLVVIAIIAILAAILIPTATAATEKAREAADVANIRSLVAQYSIDSLEGSATWTTPTGLNYATATHGYSLDSTNNVVKYIAEKLEGGKTYTWNLTDLSSVTD